MNTQRGLTLINLLVGLLVSSIVLIGMMLVFRNSVQVVVPAAEASRSDGERVSAFLSTQLLLQDAGFGINAPAYGTHFRILNNNALVALAATEGATATGNTAVWLSAIAGTTQCEGLQADTSGGLWRVTCDVTMGNITQANQLILPSQAAGEGVLPITITATRGLCRPFGVGLSGNIAVRIALQGATLRQLENSTCLANFAQP